MTESTKKLYRIARRQPALSFGWIRTIRPRLDALSTWSLPKENLNSSSSGDSAYLVYDGHAWSFEENDRDARVERRTSQLPEEWSEEITTRIYCPLSLETSLG